MNKFILVPQEMYQGLISPDNYADTSNLESVRVGMENIKRNKRMKASTKNVLVNQQRRRYLKMRKDLQDKPIKVKIDEPKRYLTDQSVQTVQTPEEESEENELFEIEDIPKIKQKRLKTSKHLHTHPQRNKTGRRSITRSISTQIPFQSIPGQNLDDADLFKTPVATNLSINLHNARLKSSLDRLKTNI